MRISELAKALGISPDWLRSLEKAGRIPPAPRDRNGHRRFGPEDMDRLRAVLFPAPPTSPRDRKDKEAEVSR